MLLYTIGYTAFSINDFINALKQNKIKAVVDVRSIPYSEHHPDYNKENLEHILSINKIQYRNFSKEFGARQTEPQYFSKTGYLDFDLFTKSPIFCNGYNLVANALTKGYNIALMCAEKNPAICHRSIMISHIFYKNGFAVSHLLQAGGIESQTDIEQQLLDNYFPDRNQLSMFDTPDQEDLVEIAYRKRNAEIGYRIGGNE